MFHIRAEEISMFHLFHVNFSLCIWEAFIVNLLATCHSGLHTQHTQHTLHINLFIHLAIHPQTAKAHNWQLIFIHRIFTLPFHKVYCVAYAAGVPSPPSPLVASVPACTIRIYYTHFMCIFLYPGTATAAATQSERQQHGDKSRHVRQTDFWLVPLGFKDIFRRFC